MTVATDQKFPTQVAMAMPLRGWALTASGHGEEGRVQIQQGLAAYQARRATRDRPYHLALLAEASVQVGLTDAGLEALDEALATVAQRAACWWEAELYRLRGEFLSQAPGVPPGAAEACFQRSLDVACRQQARSRAEVPR
jgi:predicted ATPase